MATWSRVHWLAVKAVLQFPLCFKLFHLLQVLSANADEEGKNVTGCLLACTVCLVGKRSQWRLVRSGGETKAESTCHYSAIHWDCIHQRRLTATVQIAIAVPLLPPSLFLVCLSKESTAVDSCSCDGIATEEQLPLPTTIFIHWHFSILRSVFGTSDARRWGQVAKHAMGVGKKAHCVSFN